MAPVEYAKDGLTLLRFRVQQKPINFCVHGGQHERRKRAK